MHSHAAAAICSLLLLPLASAGCYKDWVDNANTHFALDNVKTAAAYLQGNLAPYQERALCVTDEPAGNFWLFSVKNEEGTGTDLTQDTIDGYLRTEVNGCLGKGGKRRYGQVAFNADPNSGVCMDTGYINDHAKNSREELWDIQEDASPPRQRRGGAARQRRHVVFTPVMGPVPTRPEAEEE